MWTKCFFLVVEEGLEEVFLVEDALSFREEERDQVVEAMPFGPPPAEDAAAADRADDDFDLAYGRQNQDSRILADKSIPTARREPHWTQSCSAFRQG